MDALETSQQNLIAMPVLALPYGEGYLTIGSDACERQTDCLLMQDQLDEANRPLDYCSQTRKAAEQSYDAAHR